MISALIIITICLAIYLSIDLVKKIASTGGKVAKSHKEQKALEANKCKDFHEYVDIHGIKACTKCGFCAGKGVFVEVDLIHSTITCNNEIDRINKEGEARAEEVYKEFNMSKHDIHVMLEKIRVINGEVAIRSSEIINKYKEGK